MILFRHELRQGRAAFWIWTAALALLMDACVFLFPGMKGQMAAAGRLFGSMGGFTAAFGMDRLNVGTLIGFYCVECGSILGLGGAFFACHAGVSALAKEERDKTAEFLLTHPLPRARIVTGKLAAVLTQIAGMNLIVLCLAVLSVGLIGEKIPFRQLLLMHGACCLLQVELACACAGISAFLRRGGAGIGMGLAAVMYLLNLIANLTDRAAFLKYISPFGYCEGADILTGVPLGGRIAAGMLLACMGVAGAYWRYGKKDIR